MKNLKFSILILVGFLALTGCNHLEITPPTPISPKGDSGYQILRDRMVFTWSSVEGAIGYGLKIGEDSKFETMVFTGEQLTDTSARVPLDSFPQEGIYSWRVKAESEDGWSDWSEIAEFPYSNEDWRPWLISPEDGTRFDTLAPTFVWSSQYHGKHYIIRVSQDTLVSWKDTLKDTTCTMPEEAYQKLMSGEYQWRVANLTYLDELLWSETRDFTVTKIVGLDLDTTYFPFGLGYEWCYERHNHSWRVDEPDSDTYDTVIIEVEDSTYDSMGLIFHLSDKFHDVRDEARIIQEYPNILTVPICLNWWWLRDTVFVSLNPSTRTRPFKIEYNSDTLVMSNSCEYTQGYPYISTQITKRIKGTGIIWQNDADESIKEGGFKKDRLLYFYNGRDTVYKTE